MMDRESDLSPPPRISSVIFDYGADAEACAEDAVAISERGMRLRSHWRFEIGTQLSVSLVPPKPHANSKRMVIEATVVWCEKTGERCYESTFLFLELPEDQKQYLREFSFPVADGTL